MNDWTHKTVAVTGGNSGIGRAAAKEFHGRGANVALFGRDEVTLAQAARELPGVITARGDISHGADLQGWYDEIARAWTDIDALVPRNRGSSASQAFTTSLGMSARWH